jgi:hypothetical protein
MLCRTTKITHRGTGVSLETPLLVPSFSSKGFSRSCAHREGEFVSGLHKQFAAVSEYITDTVLISAFDIRHGYLPAPAQLPNYPEILFLDSGGYEVSDYVDLSDIEEPQPKREQWSVDLYKSVLAEWPAEKPVVLVSYDHPNERHSFAEQVKAARDLFRPHSNHLRALLLKPETVDQETITETLKTALGKTGELQHFDIIGVTEREVGNSPSSRMLNIAKLRLAMDDAGLVHIPVHVFGALDPLSASLYFMAGAEIFDGLTWLRYAYKDCRCVYTHNHGPVHFGIQEKDKAVRALTQAANLRELQKIQNMLREFNHTKNFAKLVKLGGWDGAEKFFSDAYDSLDTQLKGRAK